MTRDGRERVVLLGFDATPGRQLDALVALARCLGGPATDVHVVLVGDQGDRGGLDLLQELADVTVVDRLRTRGVGGVLDRIGRPDLASRWKGLAVRLARRRWSDLPFVLVDDRAGALAAGSSPATPWATMGSADLGGRPPARAVVRIGGNGPPDAIALEPSVLDHQDRPGEDPARWPVLLVPPPHAWEEVHHTIEIVQHLREAWPQVPVRWVADGAEDTWLARHDLAAIGLADDVSIITSSDATASAARAVVVTGYRPVDEDLVSRARAGGLPVLGFGDQADGPPLAPFAVEELQRSTDAVLGAPGWRASAQRTVAERAEARRDHAAAVAELRRVLELGDAGWPVAAAPPPTPVRPVPADG